MNKEFENDLDYEEEHEYTDSDLINEFIAQYIEGATEKRTEEELVFLRSFAKQIIDGRRELEAKLPAERLYNAMLFIEEIVKNGDMFAEMAAE